MVNGVRRDPTTSDLRPVRPDADASGGTFEAVYRRHVGFVWRSLRRLGVAEPGLEDSAHEVFLVVHRRWNDWDGRTKMRTWLFGICRGVARNARRGDRRAQRRLHAVRDLSRVVDQAPRQLDPDRHVAQRDAAALVQAFVESLDTSKRVVFELCEIEGLSPAEAARSLGDNVNTVSTRLRRARKAFAAFVDALNARAR